MVLVVACHPLLVLLGCPPGPDRISRPDSSGVACEGCPPLAELVKRYEAAGGRYYVCPICFNAKNLGPASLISGAELQGTIPLWAWIGDEAATTFSY
jgi:hypothetical protein